MFEVIIQPRLVVIIAREVVRAFRKNVVAKCYGGDISQTQALSRQKEGKKRMKQSARWRFRRKRFWRR